MDVPIKSDGLIEFLASVEAGVSVDNRDHGYKTTSEICDALQVSEKRVRVMLRKLIQIGKVEHGHVHIRSIDGRNVRSNGYRLVAN